MANTRRILLVLALAFLVLGGGCDSTPKQPDRGGRPDEPKTGEDETVTVPRQCVDQIGEFFNRDQLLLADYVTIDASADPFFAASTTVVDDRVVEKIEAVDEAKKLTIIRYRNRTGRTNFEGDMPQVRFGDGLLVVATREITIRFHKRVNASRPIFFDLAAS
ncbi:MAG: hypothetical protein GY704_16825, partial [Phycisphaeraceae bacterium]|nr:hypothetical protein [Phycisphaeraceae bacterium]